MIVIFFVVSFSLMLATPSQAQVESNSEGGKNDKVVISDSTAVQALQEAESCIDSYRDALRTQSKSRIVDATRRAARSELLFEIYLRSDTLSGDREKLVSGMEDAMSKMATGFPQKAVVSDLSDQKRVAMPLRTVLKMLEENMKKFQVK